MAKVIDIRQGELDLDPVVAKRCEERLAIARTHMAAGFYHWLEAGKQFAANKLDLGPRHWAPWLREHNIVTRTADRLVAIAERFTPILDTVSRIDAADLTIDFRALQLLASPNAPQAAAEQAVERAAAGEHITKAEADKMVADAQRTAVERAVAEWRAQHAQDVEKAIGEATGRLAGDNAALQEEIKRLRSQKADIAAIERLVLRNLGKKALSPDQWRSMAKLLGTAITVGKVMYEPISSETLRKNEENLRIASQLTQALEILAAQPLPDAAYEIAWPAQRNIFRRLTRPAIDWLIAFEKVIGGPNGKTAHIENSLGRSRRAHSANR
jgi:hypothetical protein